MLYFRCLHPWVWVLAVLLASTAVRSQEEDPAEPADPVEEPADPADEDSAPGAKEAVLAPDAKSAYWLVEFDWTALRMITPREGAGSGRVYWYMLYTLTNPSAEPRDVFVSITATSDNNKRYSDLYLPSVEREIERKEGQPLWGKADEFEMMSRRKPADPKYHYVTLKAGEKRKCVAVFNRLDPNANKITISVAGLSNEIREIVKDDGARMLEERVRELKFERPGDENAITLDSFRMTGKDWVKRTLTAGGDTGKAPGR